MSWRGWFRVVISVLFVASLFYCSSKFPGLSSESSSEFVKQFRSISNVTLHENKKKLSSGQVQTFHQIPFDQYGSQELASMFDLHCVHHIEIKMYFKIDIN
jgi:hypothetical protein